MKSYFASLAVVGATALLFAGVPSVASAQDSGHAKAAESTSAATNWYGGPAYTGAPALEATAALVKAGGGAENFSFANALNAMLGKDTVNSEVEKLNKQYGEEQVQTWLNGMTYAVTEGLKLATQQGIKLPPAPADLTGAKLATALVKAGTAEDGTFWSGLLFDQALSHDLHNKVMMKINETKGEAVDKTTHKILNQAMYDVAQALGIKGVKLASLH